MSQETVIREGGNAPALTKTGSSIDPVCGMAVTLSPHGDSKFRTVLIVGEGHLLFAFANNALGVPIAAGLLHPVTGLLLSPMIAAAAMSLSSVSVITNALRLRRVEL